jgi:hypothetical protein
MLLAEVTPLKRPGTKTKLVHRRSESGEDGEDLVELPEFAPPCGKPLNLFIN